MSQEAYIIAGSRTAIGKAKKGGFRFMTPVDMAYYAIKDLDTNEYVIDFDGNYTKLSLDDNGSYFTLYMNGLEPERYYKILIQTTVNGSTIVFDENYIFKVTNG